MGEEVRVVATPFLTPSSWHLAKLTYQLCKAKEAPGSEVRPLMRPESCQVLKKIC